MSELLIGQEVPRLDYKALYADLDAGGERAESAMRIIAALGPNGMKQVIKDACMDAKSDMFNQATLEKDVADILAQPGETGLYIQTDLVNFKRLNDTLGQQFGDTIITLSANGLSRVIRQRRNDRLYEIESGDAHEDRFDAADSFRIGGDEYAALLRNGESLRTVDVERLVRRKMLGMLSYRPLVEALEDNGVEGFGVRAGAVLLDGTVHSSFKDVQAAADPKSNKICQYVLETDASKHLVVKQVK